MKLRSRFNKPSLVALPLLGVLVIVALLFVSLHRSNVANAVSATDFDAGKIIDDGVFYNKDSMTAAQIQDFLNRLIGTCDTWGTGPSEYGGGTRAQYAASVGWSGPPYVCINNYYENPDTGETSFEKGGGAFTGGISAANIIYDAAQTYDINPQVLLVLLKKESVGPITADKWPMKSQYKYAMGYACPDSGPNYSASCDDQKAGFYKQVMLAAWQLNYYRNHPNDYRYAIGWNDIQYSTDPTCGTKHVNIQNIATLSLYIYTPYTPNDASLANYPGTAPCGSYGNRNFFMYFSEWFGTTYGNSQIDMLKADQDINNIYSTYKTQLGDPVSDILPAFDSSPRVWQDYQNGTIIWTPQNGAVPVLQGSIYNRWKALGGSAGSLGPPIGVAVTEADGRIWQDFKYGTIISSSTTGAWEMVPGPINDKWRSTGGSTGTLGRPTSGVVVSANGNRSQSFENGTIVRKNSSSPAYIITNDINTEWNDNKSLLGTPVMDPVKETNDGRIWQDFERGSIISATPGQAWTVRSGKIYDAWKSLGGSLGQLGKPTTDQATESDGRVWQYFEKGVLIQKNAGSNAYAVLLGDIYDRWKQLGGSTGELGIPLDSPTTEADGRIWQDYQNGTVIWGQDTGAWEIEGAFYPYWKQLGGSLGQLGKPTGPKHIEADSDGTRWQDFEKGRITWTDTSGWSVTIF